MKPANEVAAGDGVHETWIPLLEMATREVFDLMLSCQLTAPGTVEEPTPEVTAMVGLAGRLCGVLTVCCDSKTAALMTSKMLGVTVDKVGPEVSDALGEVCNMVAGNFKNKIPGLAEGCMLSPPTVVTGTDYSVRSQAESPGLKISLLFEHMPMVVSLQIHS